MGCESLHLLHWCLDQGNSFFSTLYAHGLWIPAAVVKTMMVKVWNFLDSGLVTAVGDLLKS